MTQAMLETCSVTWWRGYVRGRFQAVSHDPPAVIAESQPLRGGAEGPDETPDAVAALERVTQQLVDEGWEASETSGDSWFERTFTRRPLALPDPPPLETPTLLRELDAGLVTLLHEELEDARETAARERRGRLEAERHLHAVEQQPLAEGARRRRHSTAPVLAAWAVAVLCAAALSAALTHSLYATAVVTLTAAAVALGVDSWRVSR